MNNQPLPLESEFEVKRLELYLEQNPEKAQELAIIYFEDYLELVQEYKKLEQQKKSPCISVAIELEEGEGLKFEIYPEPEDYVASRIFWFY